MLSQHGCHSVMSPSCVIVRCHSVKLPNYVTMKLWCHLWCHIVISFVLGHCIVSLCGVTLWYHSVMSQCDVNMLCHCLMSLYNSTKWCHSVMHLCDVTVLCHGIMSQCDINVVCDTVSLFWRESSMHPLQRSKVFLTYKLHPNWDPLHCSQSMIHQVPSSR